MHKLALARSVRRSLLSGLTRLPRLATVIVLVGVGCDSVPQGPLTGEAQRIQEALNSTAQVTGPERSGDKDGRPVPEGYDPERWARALDLHHDSLVVDTHSDTTSLILDQDFDMRSRATTGHMDLPRIREGGLDCQIYSIYVSASYYGEEDLTSGAALAASRADASARRALDMIDAFYRTTDRNGDLMQPCFSTGDILQAVADGKHAALMGIEGGHAIEGDLGLLRMFHRLGVRYMTLTHSNHNHFADSCAPIEPRWGGLNLLGEKVVKEMNRLGMMVDLSHVSDATFYHALRVTRAPVILSHSSSRVLCEHPRNVTDDQLRRLAENGGVVMINFNCGFLDARYGALHSAWRMKTETRRRAIEKRHERGSAAHAAAIAALQEDFPAPERPRLAVLVDHVTHALRIAGADHVGLGSDFDGVPCVPEGMDDVTYLPRLTYELLERGIDAATVRKVLGGNLLRVFRATEQVALELALQGEEPFRNDPATDSSPGNAAAR